MRKHQRLAGFRTISSADSAARLGESVAEHGKRAPVRCPGIPAAHRQPTIYTADWICQAPT
jgi:hypothetical protein